RRQWFEYNLLEPLVLTALDTVFFDPVHAACVSSGNRGVLLCGDSGAGKTTMAYACARAGWTLISEDGVHVADGEPPLLVGGFWRFRLREHARTLFPEIADLPVGKAANGKQAIIIDAPSAGFQTAPDVPAGPTVFLERRPGPAELSTMSRGQVG